jgi:hypothetical protein
LQNSRLFDFMAVRYKVLSVCTMVSIHFGSAGCLGSFAAIIVVGVVAVAASLSRLHG